VNESGVDFKSLVPWLIAGLASLVAWFSRRDMSRYDRGLERIENLEKTSVTYDHLDRVLDQIRADRAMMHAENQSSLNRIEDKIDANEERSSKTRHDTKDEVHLLALKIAEMGRKSRGDYGG
jgi:hypothetical protein